MKNRTVITLIFLATVGVVGNAFANRTDSDSYYTSGYGYSGTPQSNNYTNGMAFSNREGGALTQTIVGVVKSVNAEKHAFVIEDIRDGITATVLTDSKTIASLQPAQMVTVKLRSGSPIAQSVMAGSSAHSNAVPTGMVSYSKEGNVEIQTIVGVVGSVNPEKNVFVVEDQRDGITKTVSTDSEVIASLKTGMLVSVKLHLGSPVALSVASGT